jgi:DNA topoisomerase-6 subunit B
MTVDQLRLAAELEAQKMRESNPAQYFERNLHQLGFSDPEHALLQTLKEMIDNSLDATELGGILPDLRLEVEETKDEITLPSQTGRGRKASIYRVRLEDNGVGIMPDKVGDSIGKLLFGSKLTTLKQSRGQQGIGISAVVLYSQLTTLRATTVISKVAGSQNAKRIVMRIDVDRNKPVIVEEGDIPWVKDHGTLVELFLPGRYSEKVERYVKELSIGNPHMSLTLTKKIAGESSELMLDRVTDNMPPATKEIKPHLSSIDAGTLYRMAEVDNDCRTLASFLSKHFAMISGKTARRILQAAKLPPNLKPKSIKAGRVLEAARNMKLRRPKLDVLSYIGEDELRSSLKNLFPDADFIDAVSRPPWSYQGIPFRTEVAVAMGGQSVTNYNEQKKVAVIRLANKVPLPYDLSDCELYRAVSEVDWRNYGLDMGEGGIPTESVIFVTSIVASKVPYTSPGKFAVARVAEIHDELTLALQELGRRMRTHIQRRNKEESAAKRLEYFRGYYEILAEEVATMMGTQKLDYEGTIRKLFGRTDTDV